MAKTKRIRTATEQLQPAQEWLNAWQVRTALEEIIAINALADAIRHSERDSETDAAVLAEHICQLALKACHLLETGQLLRN